MVVCLASSRSLRGKKIMKLLPSYQSRLIFYVNGRKVEDSDVDPRTTLASYIRQKLKLTGTKVGCNEGGCGACTVMISERLQNGRIKHYSVNACLTLVCSVHGKAVTTVEGIGSVRSKLHPVQEVFSKGHGSQCGFCTPGFIMAMYSLLRNNPHPTKNEIDEAIQGNLCRCTGYRPILESFYTFAKAELICNQSNGTINGADYVNSVNKNIAPLKENGGCCGGNNGQGCCRDKTKSADFGEKIGLVDRSVIVPYDQTQDPVFPPELLLNNYEDDYLKLDHESCKWFRPTSLDQLLELKAVFPHAKLVVGNTEIGVEMKFKNCNYPVLINPTAIPELKHTELTDKGLFIGASVCLTDMEKVLRSFDDRLHESKTKVFVAFTKMLHWFAGKHIRNAASAGGNLMTASPISDLNPLFMASGSVAILHSKSRGRREIVIDGTFFPAYRTTDVEPDEILVGIRIPLSNDNEFFAGYKQAQRREDDISIVNAGMRVVFKPGTNVIENIRLSFGGMAPTTVMAKKVSKQLVGREWNNQLLEDITGNILLEDLPLPPGVPGGMERYRQTLCLSFFYKFYLSVSHELHLKGIVLNDISKTLKCSLEEYNYMPMEGTQIYQDVAKDQSINDAVGKPQMHLSGDKHTTGEAVYCDDVQVADALHASFVISQKSHAKLIEVDPSEALALSGVISYVDYRDIPEKGSNIRGLMKDEKVFIENEVTAYGQVIGMILAETADISRKASQLVKVKYEELPSIITMEQAIEAESYMLKKPIVVKTGDPDQVISNSEHIAEGEIRFGGQEHFYLETHCCIVIPKEGDELEVISSTQDVTELQIQLSRSLGIASHKIVVKVKRIGGGFGGKQTAAFIVALPCAVAALKLRRPVRCALERFDDMAMTGTRHPYLGKYKMAYTNEGKLTGYHVDLYSNGGYSEDLSTEVMYRAVWHTDNAYKIPNFYVSGTICKTNCPSSTAFRGFGCPQGMIVVEQCITDIAYSLGIPPETIRERNLYDEGDQTFYNQTLEKCNNRRCWDECLKISEFHERRQAVDEFNKLNRYKKRGISVIPTKYGVSFGVRCLMQGGALVHIYRDGSVLISHGGMEMGQGLHTKMAQVATRVLGVPLNNIYINDTSTDKVPNSSATAASVGSDLNGEAVRDACEILMSRLKPVMETNPNKCWSELVEEAYMNQINLSANGFCKIDVPNYFCEPEPAKPYSYFAYGAGCSEVEIDCLTGDHRVLRTDLVVDVGDSLNPAIDIGQIEGAFIQGYGLMTMEEMKYSPTGVVYTRGPGTYKIPSADDVPREFNVKLLKNSSNPHAIFSSKAVGEPPMFLGSSVFFAIKDAVKSARSHVGLTGPFQFDSPATSERIRLACEDKLTSKVSVPIAGTYKPWTVRL